MKKPFALALILSALLCGCGESPQEKAYDEALKAEEAAAPNIGASATSLVADYDHVIGLDPTSKWAERSRNRINLIRGIVEDDKILQHAK